MIQYRHHCNVQLSKEEEKATTTSFLIASLPFLTTIIAPSAYILVENKL